jgi:predicted ABC-type ATPase
MASPQFLVIGGANGSGKSTSAPALLPLSVPFINADEIAKTLSAEFGVARDVHAERLLLSEWNRLEVLRADFAVETTLASRTLAPRIARLRAAGYQFHLMYFWLSSSDLAVQRVAERVRRGGHGVPEPTIRRRYDAGLRHFFSLYMPLADTWRAFDNSVGGMPRLIASGINEQVLTLEMQDVWAVMKGQVSNE